MVQATLDYQIVQNDLHPQTLLLQNKLNLLPKSDQQRRGKSRIPSIPPIQQSTSDAADNEAKGGMHMMRSKSDLGPAPEQYSVNGNAQARGQDLRNDWIRHGWHEQMNSEEYLSALRSVRQYRPRSFQHGRFC